VIEAYFVDGGLAGGGEDGCGAEFGRPEDEAVEGADEELEGADGEGC